MSLKIEACRICGNNDLKRIVHLGTQKLTGVFPPTISKEMSEGELDLVKCDDTIHLSACGLVQLRNSFDHNEMYGENYGYRSGLNQSMIDHLNQIANKVQSFVKFNPGDIMLDIGSNDSTSLSFYPKNIRLIGIDPTGNKFKQYYPEHIQLVPDFFSEQSFRKVFPTESAKAVTSIAMFYDLEDPISFMKDIHSILEDDGIWLFEQSYIVSMLEANAYDTICHEHVEYYALKQIFYMCEKVGFKIIDIEINDINGGSFQVVCAKTNSKHIPNTAKIEEVFNKEKACLEKLLHEFSDNIEKHRIELIDLIHKLNADGYKIFGYGASTKGNVVLQYCGITEELIPYIAEVNPDKFGSYTPGSFIPIISEAEAKLKNPDYFLVLPWHFKENIIRREASFLKEGGKLIFPLPTIQIVSG